MPVDNHNSQSGKSPAQTSASAPATPVGSVVPPLEQRFRLAFEYPVVFTDSLFQSSNLSLVDAVRRGTAPCPRRCQLVLESAIDRLWPELRADIEKYFAEHHQHLSQVSAPMILDGGEACKNDPSIPPQLLQRFATVGLDRQCCVVVIGGGAFQDMVGYCASLAHRGLRIVRVPTTVLSQNDGGVGVKNGVNAFGKKNFLGTFAPPWAVLNDHAFLSTLANRDLRAGMAEAVKVAVLRDDQFFDWICEHSQSLGELNDDALRYLIRRCAELHLEHITTGGDPFEQGSSRPLDLGHWSAHELESLTQYELRHGEAVAIGLAIDALYSEQLGWLSTADCARIINCLHQLQLATHHPSLDLRAPSGERRVLAGIDEFRQHLGGDLRVPMLRGIAVVDEIQHFDAGALERALLATSRSTLNPAPPPRILGNPKIPSAPNQGER